MIFKIHKYFVLHKLYPNMQIMSELNKAKFVSI